MQEDNYKKHLLNMKNSETTFSLTIRNCCTESFLASALSLEITLYKVSSSTSMPAYIAEQEQTKLIIPYLPGLRTG
jgi:hypothetical protein